MHGVGWGKRWRSYQNFTYQHSFFTDPTIATLTSGTLSQNVDLAGLSFPRRLGVRFNADFIKQYHMKGMRCHWESFEDPEFTKSYGKDFIHDDLITQDGWARYYFKGKYPKDTAYIRMQVINTSNGMLNRTFCFKFTKGYQTSLDGRYYVTDPITDEKIVNGGVLTEMRAYKTKEGKIVYRTGNTTFKQEKVVDIQHQGSKQQVDTRTIIRKMARYSEKPKMVFLVKFLYHIYMLNTWSTYSLSV